VLGALGLGDQELSADQLDGVAGLEDTKVDELLVLDPGEAVGPNLVSRHGGIVSAVSERVNVTERRKGDRVFQGHRRLVLDWHRDARNLHVARPDGSGW